MKTLTIVALLLLFAASVMAQTVTLQWDLSTSEPLGAGGGYKCYQSKQTLTYTSTPAGQVAPGMNTVTLSNLPYGRNYFVCTAFVADGTESEYSNEVSTTIKPKPPKLTNAIQTALMAPVKAVTAVASLFTSHKNLRIQK